MEKQAREKQFRRLGQGKNKAFIVILKVRFNPEVIESRKKDSVIKEVGLNVKGGGSFNSRGRRLVLPSRYQNN